MTGLILVIDDVPANVKLLEAKLSNEYFDVLTGEDGYQAIEKAKQHKPDLVLLDVMMPGMDGFETCRKLKEDPDVSHIPVVMVTALSEPSDRISGLEAGADDFITKPINDTALFARVRSLVRMKVLIDELRLRDQSGVQMGLDTMPQPLNMDVSGAKILIVDDDAVQSRRIEERLGTVYEVDTCSSGEKAVPQAKEKEYDLVIISTQLSDVDALRLATQMRAIEYIRNVPIIMMVDEEDKQLMLKGLELGINDYLIIPIDHNEMFARIKTQIRRKKYQDALKSNYQESVSMAITDGLTRLYNRHYLDTHLTNLVQQSHENNKPMSMMMMDMDHFKSVNDTYGHDVGDEVLRQLADIIVDTMRSSDLVARYGGEEFAVLMPETDVPHAIDAAERLRQRIERYAFKVNHEVGQLEKTVSIGLSYLIEGDTPESLIKRADNNLYEAKNTGRNKVVPRAEECVQPAHSSESQNHVVRQTVHDPVQLASVPEAKAVMPPSKLHLGGELPQDDFDPGNMSANISRPLSEETATIPTQTIAQEKKEDYDTLPKTGAGGELGITETTSVSLELSRPAIKNKEPELVKALVSDEENVIDDEPPGTF